MQRLYEFCERWENCGNKEFRDVYGEKMIKGEDFDSLTEDEIKKLNELCSKCKNSLKVEEKKCPICGNENLQGSPLISFHKDQPYPIPITSIEGGGITQYLYRCENCKRLLYSHEKF
ncbi:MAG: hypothetical protein E3J56_11120 [Candidatus Aminicenantes bacterium]|nr:MAG: hypothetical protein E3J56_11120 [Candidatus Aminicenantes bacterium]